MKYKLAKSTLAALLGACLLTGCATETIPVVGDEAENYEGGFNQLGSEDTSDFTPSVIKCDSAKNRYRFNWADLENEQDITKNVKLVLGPRAFERTLIRRTLTENMVKDLEIMSKKIHLLVKTNGEWQPESFIPVCSGTTQYYQHEKSVRQESGKNFFVEASYNCSECAPARAQIEGPTEITLPVHCAWLSSETNGNAIGHYNEDIGAFLPPYPLSSHPGNRLLDGETCSEQGVRIVELTAKFVNKFERLLEKVQSGPAEGTVIMDALNTFAEKLMGLTPDDLVYTLRWVTEANSKELEYTKFRMVLKHLVKNLNSFVIPTVVATVGGIVTTTYPDGNYYFELLQLAKEFVKFAAALPPT